MTRRALAALGAVVLAATLAGCAATGAEQGASTDALRQESITLQDGRTVQCVVYSAPYKGGLSCDWVGAR
ncbi:hypothetical protein [Microbacterium sp. B24]|uniref:hypothetical protein n=1 Tax=Microbacterium sp. B24 TaxID=95616 RepID=UPI00041F56BF|nr:hypothetical protein [Microbacterium sp. B24]